MPVWSLIILGVWILFSVFQVFGGWKDGIEAEYTLVHYSAYKDVNWAGKIFFILLFTVLMGPLAILCHIVIFLNWLFTLGVK